MEKRYQKNLGIMSEKQLHTIQSLRVVVVGCGGIGGHISNHLVRLGVTQLILVDFDTFEESNLNRQLFCTESSIGRFKTEVVQEELSRINSSCQVTVITSKIEDVSPDKFASVDVIFDAVDTPKTKVYLSKLATISNTLLLHGACAGWYGQVAIITPGSTLIQDLYDKQKIGIEQSLSNQSFMPSITASCMISEWIQYIIDPSHTANQLLLIDLHNKILSTLGNEVLQ